MSAAALRHTSEPGRAPPEPSLLSHRPRMCSAHDRGPRAVNQDVARLLIDKQLESKDLTSMSSRVPDFSQQPLSRPPRQRSTPETAHLIPAREE